MPVSEQDVAHVRLAFEEFDITALRAGGLRAYVERFYDDDAVIEHAEGFPVPAARHMGHEGYVEWFEETYGAYSDVRWEPESVVAEGERVLAIALVKGRPHGHPTELEVRVAMVYRMHRGRIAHVPC